MPTCFCQMAQLAERLGAELPVDDMRCGLHLVHRRLPEPAVGMLLQISIQEKGVHGQQAVQGVGGVSGYYISLGQPVYIQGMFFGLEFPASETEIEGNQKVRIRYYSGKSFEMLASEGRMVDSGTFTTWKEVIGATRSTDMDVIQTDFFSYIHDISVPVDFRIQYNSWYDFMLDINENNILNSFREVERGLTQ